MEAEGKPSQSLSIEQGLENGGGHQAREYVLPSAHTIDHDSWQQVGLMLVTSFNCGYILSFQILSFHFFNGQRFIRYRDLMGHHFGREMYYVTWIFQFMTIILGNTGFILLGGRGLKEINSVFSDNPLRLQYFIIITGVAYCVFAIFIPTMSDMRIWLGPSTIVTFTYIVILLVLLAKDVGKSTNTKQDYDIKGSKVEKVFNGFSAISAIVVCNNPGLLPEIQSTLRKPAVTNMRKALYLQFTVGLVVYYGVSVLGYWAYGSTVSEYLPEELSGPRWVKVLINSTVFLQSIVSQHMFIAPVHEALDTSSTSFHGGLRKLVWIIYTYPSNLRVPKHDFHQGQGKDS
ncbi:hypothetical protein FNV43_RR21425 [Rhamnella rubrinervis]|uniref:Amino acid transporter transmembrane domain-containing protein n=1 Tax=Rhamnella rubrinervis TaxID=2594499 RepID=A0A8K0E1N1_9ROSA|nr:hypothetical protein FNV43_RR21425 [Rhamnella rubrinervis]